MVKKAMVIFAVPAVFAVMFFGTIVTVSDELPDPDARIREVVSAHETRIARAASEFIDAVDQADAEIKNELGELSAEFAQHGDEEGRAAVEQMLESLLNRDYPDVLAEAAHGAKNDRHAGLVSALGPVLVNASGEEAPSSLLSQKDYVLLYFSAEWCPPCRQFTPLLTDFYEEYSEKGSLEVVFFSVDRSADDMYAYMQGYDMNWLAVPYDRRNESGLAGTFNVRSVPRLLALDGEGRVVKDSQVQGPLQVLHDLASEL